MYNAGATLARDYICKFEHQSFLSDVLYKELFNTLNIQQKQFIQVFLHIVK